MKETLLYYISTLRNYHGWTTENTLFKRHCCRIESNKAFKCRRHKRSVLETSKIRQITFLSPSQVFFGFCLLLPESGRKSEVPRTHTKFVGHHRLALYTGVTIRICICIWLGLRAKGNKSVLPTPLNSLPESMNPTVIHPSQ